MAPSILCASFAACALAVGAAAQPASSTEQPGSPGSFDPSTSASPLTSLFPLPAPLADTIGAGAEDPSTLVTAASDGFSLATTRSRSPLDEGPIFIGQASGSSLGIATVLSGGLLDSLLDTSDLLDPGAASMAPGVGVASGATFGGSAIFSEFCRPEDFTCR